MCDKWMRTVALLMWRREAIPLLDKPSANQAGIFSSRADNCILEISQPRIKIVLRRFEAARLAGPVRNPLNLDTKTNNCFPSQKIRTLFATDTIGPIHQRILHCLRRACWRDPDAAAHRR